MNANPYGVTQTFSRVHDDPVKDPSRRLKFEAWERGAVTLATAVLAFGGAAGNTVVTLVGVVGLLVVIVAMSQMPDRKARRAEREKRPEYEWIEDHNRTGAGIVLGVAWFCVMVVVGTILFFFPNGYALTGGVIAAGVSAAIVMAALLIVDR